MKTCFKCHQEKPLSEFYAHPGMTDGTLGKCKDCTKQDVHLNYQRKRQQYAAYYAAREKTQRRKLQRFLAQLHARAQDRPKYLAILEAS